MIIKIFVSILFMVSVFFLGWFIYLSYQLYKIVMIKSEIKEIDKTLMQHRRQLTRIINQTKKIK